MTDAQKMTDAPPEPLTPTGSASATGSRSATMQLVQMPLSACSWRQYQQRWFCYLRHFDVVVVMI